MLFFFSSRRRHTRCSRDWSSDVCSSDLLQKPLSTEYLVQARDAARKAVGGVKKNRIAVSYFSRAREQFERDRKSTRLNSSHGYISYAVFCLKKKTQHDVHEALLPPH